MGSRPLKGRNPPGSVKLSSLRSASLLKQKKGKVCVIEGDCFLTELFKHLQEATVALLTPEKPAESLLKSTEEAPRDRSPPVSPENCRRVPCQPQKTNSQSFRCLYLPFRALSSGSPQLPLLPPLRSRPPNGKYFQLHGFISTDRGLTLT